ncbi:helix-turn-helix domain-containing protein [Solidesulfovibrio sp.]
MTKGAMLSVFRPAATPGIVCASGVGVAADIGGHAHGALVVGLCLAGGRRIVSGGGQWDIGPGEGFIVPAGVRHACASLDPAGHAYLALAVAAGALVRAGAPAGAPEVWVRRWKNDEAARLLGQLADCLAGPAVRPAVVLEALGALAACLGLHPGTPPSLHPATRRAKAVIDAAPAAPHSLAGLARLAGVGQYYLERLFVRDLGVPLGEYVLGRRVALAAAHIAGGDGLAQAALAAGFCDQSHLSRHFRRRMGVPPGRYRESAAAG